MSDCEEMDSFTQNLIERTRERQKLLNEGIDDIEDNDGDEDNVDNEEDNESNSFAITSNVSKTSLKSALNLSFDNKSNVMSVKTPKVSESSQLLFDNLIKISPNKKRVPLNQRLSSIARSYYCEDIENIDFIDNESNDLSVTKDYKSVNVLNTKKETENALTESPTKKRLLLNERLSQIARSYYPSDEFESNKIKDNNNLLSNDETYSHENNNSMSGSPLKKISKKSNEVNSDSIESKPFVNKSPVKRILFSEKSSDEEKKSAESHTTSYKMTESLSSKKSNNVFNISPVKTVKKQIEPIFEVKENQTQNEKKESPKKLLFNSNNGRESINVSNAIKQFESKPKSEKPENLSLRAKTDLFEKAILAENEAKSKQYYRKRVATQTKSVDNQSCSTSKSNQLFESKFPKTDELLIKRPKSIENSSPSKNVSNNILMKRQLIEQRLFATESSTANSVMKEVENRKKELEILKRPMKQRVETETEITNRDNDSVNTSQESEHIFSEDNENENLNNDCEAHQTICEAFEEIENLSETESEALNENIEKSKSNTSIRLDIDFNESPTKKNRLYPDLFTLEEVDEIHGSSSSCYPSSTPTPPPPTKPPRQYSTSNTTPMRTISFYRREQSQKSNNTTPVLQTFVLKEKKVIKEKENDEEFEERNKQIEGKIHQLKEKVETQNLVAGQVSQAIGLCLETNEFKDSTEYVEAERLLLLSAQTRIACLNEISKLKIRLSDKKLERNVTKGCLSLYNIQIPIKGEFLVAKAKGTVSENHHLICLIYNGADVKQTDLLNTDKDINNGKLDFSFGDHLPDLYHDFNVQIQVFGLITKTQVMPHDIKYHIKRTPKKNKTVSMKSPTVRSPGGPNAVLSTKFSLLGVININLSKYMKKSFKLENFCFMSPLEGSILVKTELKVEHNYNKEGSFDIRGKSGFWSLQWLVLRGHKLAFWRFAEDVNKKAPLGCIDLKECINPKVSTLPSSMRHICMRPNTIALITITNPPKNVFTKGGTIHKSNPIKYLLCANNKEECIEWCEELSTVLNYIRLWDSDSIKPYSDEEFEKLLISLD